MTMTECIEATLIRVLIADDRPMFRDGIQACLKRDDRFAVVGATDDSGLVLPLVTKLEPDVLVLGDHLNEIAGVEVVREVRSSFPRVAVLMIAAYDEPGYFQALWKMGVHGYVPRTVSGDEIVTAVQAVAQGRRIALGGTAIAGLTAEPVSLTAREYEVLQLIVAGRRDAEIAQTLNVSQKTVSFHVGHLLTKLDARSRTQAVVKAHRLGLTNRVAS